MEKNNQDVRKAIRESKYSHWEVAYAVGIASGTLSVWLRTPLTEERRNRIEDALARLAQRGAAVDG